MNFIVYSLCEKPLMAVYCKYCFTIGVYNKITSGCAILELTFIISESTFVAILDRVVV